MGLRVKVKDHQLREGFEATERPVDCLGVQGRREEWSDAARDRDVLRKWSPPF
eukprot:COSAG06_NODE_1236_length_10137_cov_3.357342_5_plen_53_part_00